MHRRIVTDLQFADNVLEEVELFVRGRRPELIALVFLLLGADLAVVADDGVAALHTEGRIGDDHVGLPAAGLREGIGAIHGRIIGVGGGADAVEVEVHARSRNNHHLCYMVSALQKSNRLTHKPSVDPMRF